MRLGRAAASHRTQIPRSHLTVEARDLIARFDRLTAGIDDLVEARMRVEFAGLLRPPGS